MASLRTHPFSFLFEEYICDDTGKGFASYWLLHINHGFDVSSMDVFLS